MKGTGRVGTASSARAERSGRPPRWRSSPETLRVSLGGRRAVFRVLSTDRYTFLP